MNKPPLLSLSFIEKRPFAAAQTLADIPPAEAAAFLNVIPPRYAALVLAHMDQWASTAAITRMEAAIAAAAFCEMEQIAAAARLRFLGEAKRAELLALLPAGKRRKLVAALSFPDDAVGAHMQSAIITVPQEATVNEVIAQFRKSSGAETELVYVLDGAQRLRGVVKASTLLQAPANARVADLADAEIEALSSRSRLDTVTSLAAWDEYSELPVVNRRKQLIGCLARKAARQDDGAEEYRLADQTVSILGGILGAFFASAVGVGQLLADVSPPRSTAEGTAK